VNVEFCASIKAIQYLFKYQLKVSDQATISLQDDANPNEMDVFQASRYVGSMEAIWRIHEFQTVEVKPSIMRLPVHLDSQQRVLFDPNDLELAQEALENAECTPLTHYFKANIKIPKHKTFCIKNFQNFLSIRET
jgi:hypothetical protein